MLNALLAATGFKERWQICWVAHLPGKAIIYGDGTYTFAPKLTTAHIDDLRKMLAAETSKAAGCEVDPKRINITGLARIGG